MKALAIVLLSATVASAATVTFSWSPNPLPDGTPYTSVRAWRCNGGPVFCALANRSHWFVVGTFPPPGCADCTSSNTETFPSLTTFRVSFYMTARVGLLETLPSNVISLACSRASGRLRCQPL